VIGGTAAILHGVPRATLDLDILIEATFRSWGTKKVILFWQFTIRTAAAVAEQSHTLLWRSSDKLARATRKHPNHRHHLRNNQKLLCKNSVAGLQLVKIQPRTQSI